MIIIDDEANVYIGPLWTRNLMVESIMSKDAEYARMYAQYVIQGRWPEGGIDSI